MVRDPRDSRFNDVLNSAATAVSSSRGPWLIGSSANSIGHPHVSQVAEPSGHNGLSDPKSKKNRALSALESDRSAHTQPDLTGGPVRS
jgi:hypothetical protein